jgi:hypothetical protein
MCAHVPRTMCAHVLRTMCAHVLRTMCAHVLRTMCAHVLRTMYSLGTAPLLQLSRNDAAPPATLFARGEPVSTYASVPTRLGFYGDCSFNEV